MCKVVYLCEVIQDFDKPLVLESFVCETSLLEKVKAKYNGPLTRVRYTSFTVLSEGDLV